MKNDSNKIGPGKYNIYLSWKTNGITWDKGYKKEDKKDKYNEDEIQKQLEKLRIAKIDSYDELKHTYTFKKHKGKDFKIDNVYVIKLSSALMNPKNNEILISNWIIYVRIMI